MLLLARWFAGGRGARKWIYPDRARAGGVEGLRDALARCLLLALLPYAAVHLAGRATSAERPASALDAILEAAGLDPVYPGSQHPDSGALLFLLAPLDILAYLAMAASAFLLCAAVARAASPRAAFPHPRLARALRAAAGPLYAWRDACHATVDGVFEAGTPRDALLALALGAYVAYSAVYFVGMMVPLPPHHGPLLRALDAHASVAAFGAVLFLAIIVDRAVSPACARLWRRL